jgi:alanyl-tRNA synthetase
MFYGVTPEHSVLTGTFNEEVEAGRIMEIWNDVFMEFNKTADGKFEPLKNKNVDTGMGLERTISVLNGKQDSFDNELFLPLFEKIRELSGKKYDESEEVKKAIRIIADHIKAATFILGEGLEPSNVERGYVLRRLIRRAVRYGMQLGINNIFTFKLAQVVIEIYQDVYLELRKQKDFIEEQLVREEKKFEKTLEQGIREFRNIIETRIGGTTMDKRLAAHSVFTLYTSFGFPIELIIEMAKEKGLDVDLEIFKQDIKKHQELSRAGAEQKFAGGLADHSEQTTRLHTAAHLMLAALRQVLGEYVYQKGSNITVERLRFDFSHPQKMTPEEIKQVEDLVNEKINEKLPVVFEEMPLDEAKENGATGVFGHKYGERVKVYSIGPLTGLGQDFSKEICGGPHVENTRVLGKFKIIKEEASSAGIRRIKAILE